MVFSSPTVLWALSLIAIPIILHLFHIRRYKKVYFSDVSLIKEVQTTANTKNRLQNLLILLARILFVVFLVMAFAEPLIPSQNNSSTAPYVAIYIDNSFSMQSSSGEGTLLQQAQQSAFEIVDSYPKGTRFQLITNQFNANEKRFTDVDLFLQSLDEVDASIYHRKLVDVLKFHRQSMVDIQSANTDLFIISDFSNMLDSSRVDTDSTSDVYLIPLTKTIDNNISIDSIWLSTPIAQANVEQTLYIRLTNHGSQDLDNLAVSIFLEQERIAMPILSLDADEVADTSIVFTANEPGILSGKASVDDAPVTFDNTYHFTINVTQSIPVVEIRGDNLVKASPFEKVFQSSSFVFDAFAEKQLIMSTAEKADLLIINQLQDISTGIEALIQEKLELGGNVLLVLPNALTSAGRAKLYESFGIQVGEWDTARIEVNRLSENHYLFANVFESREEKMQLPTASGHYPISRDSHDETILEFFDKSPLLASKSIANGELFILTSPLVNGAANFDRHALFVPVMYNMAAHAGIKKPIAYPVNAQVIPYQTKDEVLEMRHVESELRFIPGTGYRGLILGDQVEQAGHYNLVLNDSQIDQFAFNYDRGESSLTEVAPTDILEFFGRIEWKASLLEADKSSLALKLAEANIGTKLWPLFIALALLLLLFETVLLKRRQV